MIVADYIGTTARMVPVRWSTSISESEVEPYSFVDSRAKRWAFASSRKLPREWDVSVVASSRDAATLREILHGGWGNGPFRWVPAVAHQSNVLTPAQSLLRGLAVAGGMDTADGWAPASVLGPAPVTLASGASVLPGAPLTVSVDTTGAATLTVVLRNATGGVVSTLTATAAGTLAQRLSLSIPSVVATARTVDVQVSGHIRAARPQVTWTRGPVPYGIGAGADSVVLASAGRAAKVIARGSGDVWSDVTVKILEVG